MVVILKIKAIQEIAEDGSVSSGQGDEPQELSFRVGERKKRLQALQIAAKRFMKELREARLGTQTVFLTDSSRRLKSRGSKLLQSFCDHLISVLANEESANRH